MTYEAHERRRAVVAELDNVIDDRYTPPVTTRVVPEFKAVLP